ncbi:fungal specific transcription factor domain-containing protein [Aspergillus affinis]|uniref:fungal specific transcription factor domain-containing protein n=1 Tax=Aspergillus affinis TaxID=1070780 RepID=UPI0022FE6554|nr:uncharacterized protein KD926_005839 [Aspergillus affinis]KAI9045896.1 hypothetical protein KD926_005839 [Aspergillus affinis]
MADNQTTIVLAGDFNWLAIQALATLALTSISIKTQLFTQRQWNLTINSNAPGREISGHVPTVAPSARVACASSHILRVGDDRTASAKSARPTASKLEEIDVVSGLFGASQKPPPSDNLVGFHNRIFKEKFWRSESIPTDQLPHISDGPGVRPRVLDQKRADELVERFCAKNSYFPFVTVPDDIASPEHRFLYLAVLTVAATEDMPLLRSLDTRFRAVLAERVIVAGEKNLDYLQGLLVYLAWYNMNVRPTNLQIHQYLHIAVCMVSELRYNDEAFLAADQNSSTISEAKNACLGCYYLSSLMSTQNKRPNIAVLPETLKSYFSEPTQSDYPHAQMMSRCFQMQMNVEAAYRNESPVHEIFRDDFLDTPPIKIAHLFLSFFKAYTPTFHPDRSTAAGLQAITTTATEFLNYLVSLPMNELFNFTIAEWTRLIVVIRDVLEFLSAAASQPDLIPIARVHAQQVSVLLECLANRLTQGSQSGRNPGEFPDMLYLFKSVLDLLLPVEAKIGLPAEDEQDLSQTAHIGPQFKQGQCPALVGMRKTDFWSAYQNNLADMPSYDLEIDFGDLFGDAPGVELSHEEWIDAANTLNM